MEWFLLIFGGYLSVSIVCSFLFVKSTYISYLKQNKNSVPKSRIGYKQRTQAETDFLETQRRGNLAKEALGIGVILGFLWFLTIPFLIVGTIWKIITKIFKRFAIDPADKEFISAKELRAAEEIVAKWNMQEAARFDKELNV